MLGNFISSSIALSRAAARMSVTIPLFINIPFRAYSTSCFVIGHWLTEVIIGMLVLLSCIIVSLSMILVPSLTWMHVVVPSRCMSNF